MMAPEALIDLTLKTICIFGIIFRSPIRQLVTVNFGAKD